jgi:hypothetical protein
MAPECKLRNSLRAEYQFSGEGKSVRWCKTVSDNKKVLCWLKLLMTMEYLYLGISLTTPSLCILEGASHLPLTVSAPVKNDGDV